MTILPCPRSRTQAKLVIWQNVYIEHHTSVGRCWRGLHFLNHPPHVCFSFPFLSVKIDFKTGKLSVSGGALSTSYDTLQFHLHWGNQSSIPGSEHTVDGKRYPMEVVLSPKNFIFFFFVTLQWAEYQTHILCNCVISFWNSQQVQSHLRYIYAYAFKSSSF